MLGFCCPGTLLLSAKYNLFCSRRCLKIGNMPSSERFFRQTKPIWRRNTWCIPRKIGNVWRKKSRRLGMLTIFKRALSQVKTWLRVFLWREGLTLTMLPLQKQKAAPIERQQALSANRGLPPVKPAGALSLSVRNDGPAQSPSRTTSMEAPEAPLASWTLSTPGMLGVVEYA